MSRRSVPSIQPTDLRDAASEESVDRIWDRLEQDLVTLRARPAARAPRTVVWAVAATFAAFGGGLFAGRVLWRESATAGSPVVATNDRTTVDVTSAGTQQAPTSGPLSTSAPNAPPRERVLSGHLRPPRKGSSREAVAVAPGWRELYDANKFAEALEALKRQPGGIAGAVSSSKSAGELMAINEIARGRGGDPAEGIKAWKRVADEFGNDPNGSIAARQLSKMYEAAGQAELAKKYGNQAAKGVFGQDALCDRMLAEQKDGNKSEASARASEYLSKYPNGKCKDDAKRILSGGDPDSDDAQPSDDPVAAPTASVLPLAPVPAPSSAPKAP